MKPRRRRKQASTRRAPKSRARPNPRPKPKRAKSANVAKPAKRARRAKRAARFDRKTALALEREVRRLRLTRGRLERRLTAAVQEIGMLRQFESRVRGLEGELARRDAEIERLRREHGERSREIEIHATGKSIPSTPS